jgi:hypothetical protein
MHLPVADASAAWVSLRNQRALASVVDEYFSIHDLYRKSSHNLPWSMQMTADAFKNASPFLLQT